MSERYTDHPLFSLLALDFKQSYRLFFSFLLLISVGLSILLVGTGAAPMMSMPWDVIVHLDTAWRIINGQVPHADFFSFTGPLTFWLTAFGMRVASPSTASIVYGSVLLFLMITPWAWLIGQSRFSAGHAFLFSLMMGVLLVAPRPLGLAGLPIDGEIRMTSYAMLYNRQGFVILSMLLVELFVPYRPSIVAKPIFSGLTSGALLALLFFGKITFFTIGILAILLYLILMRAPSVWLLACVCGVLLIYAFAHIFLSFNLGAFLTDINIISRAQSLVVRLRPIRFTLSYSFFASFLLLVVIPFLITEPKQDKNQELFFQKRQVWLPYLFIVGAGLLLCVSNAQQYDIPLFFVAGLIVLEYLLRAWQVASQEQRDRLNYKYILAALLIIPFFAGGILVYDLGSIAYSANWHRRKLPDVAESQKLQSKTLADFIVPEDADTSISRNGNALTKEYPQEINDGIALLSKHIKKDSRVVTMDFSNPFSIALELPPPRGDSTCWHQNATFSRQAALPAEQVFQDANLVMIPKKYLPGSTEGTELMIELYGDFVSKHFTEIEQSRFWRLLHRI
jgi:hypothetical protein